ncbi:MAG TPA: sulfite exporter TauE/SafE family protein, partial [Gammaproteobacteria bacterium]
LIIVLALGVGGLAKGMTGLGLPMVAVPVLAGFLGVERAVMTLVMPILVLNIWLMWTLRDSRNDVPELPWVAWPSLPGVVLGASILYLASEQLLATVLGIWIIAYLAIRFIHPSMQIEGAARKRIAPFVGFGAGSMQAATGISAPLLVPYVDALKLEPRVYVFMVATVFTVQTTTHFVVMLSLNAYSLTQLSESCIAVIPAIAFAQLGAKFRDRVDPVVFAKITRVIMFLMALRLLHGAWLS